ncbi:hypothetical protein C1701_04715 [Actinoalloteichus sp. AHMU CJ021]|uniref:Lipoprotein n=1 Tax=Actinoalloteichus caeruleus DSM 43889 TaxID=1120930 RepID=A0ABT1JHQ0_ACTCY|nr:hypothetical protein [Actinoalloteichus caeruleus]AUS77777.1 hypothetical protein C1701_04715 [Actinoalloteichus sp. AHMU CJ021]MCP2331724.1 hypothetical protein [Actinoalloteichus caeruleus DSM 43889]
MVGILRSAFVVLGATVLAGCASTAPATGALSCARTEAAPGVELRINPPLGARVAAAELDVCWQDYCTSESVRLVRSATTSTDCAPPGRPTDTPEARHEPPSPVPADASPPGHGAETTPRFSWQAPEPPVLSEGEVTAGGRLDALTDCEDPRARTELTGFVPIPELSAVPTEVSVLLAENGGGVLLNETIELTPWDLAEDGQCQDSGARAVLRVDGGGRFFAE